MCMSFTIENFVNLVIFLSITLENVDLKYNVHILFKWLTLFSSGKGLEMYSVTLWILPQNKKVLKTDIILKLSNF